MLSSQVSGVKSRRALIDDRHEVRDGEQREGPPAAHLAGNRDDHRGAGLEAAGLWERRDGGYLVVADDMLRRLINDNEERDRLGRECQRRGSHIRSDKRLGSGWILCDHCGVPLQRPDGGPIALPNGGPLGPNPP